MTRPITVTFTFAYFFWISNTLISVARHSGPFPHFTVPINSTQRVILDREKKKMGLMPEIVLNSGGRMPVLGMGTATYPVPPAEAVESAVYEAIKLGYRHFDSASLYESERPLGQAVARAVEDGLIGSRDELFITSKLWCADAHPEGVLPAIRETLR